VEAQARHQSIEGGVEIPARLPSERLAQFKPMAADRQHHCRRHRLTRQAPAAIEHARWR
jgi:hypothetical protein